jgi:hypothetical protein
MVATFQSITKLLQYTGYKLQELFPWHMRRERKT